MSLILSLKEGDDFFFVDSNGSKTKVSVHRITRGGRDRRGGVKVRVEGKGKILLAMRLRGEKKANGPT